MAMAGAGGRAPAPGAGRPLHYEEKAVGSTSLYKCETCPYMALAEDDIEFHLFTVHPELARDPLRIPCPGCSDAFHAESTLRSHLRLHHQMGIRDVKKMVKSLVLIALRAAKKETQPKNEVKVTPPEDVKMPQVIEIIPDLIMSNNGTLPRGVTVISVDDLQKMSPPNFEKVDPKEIIQEASINIVYSDNLQSDYITSSIVSSTSSCGALNYTTRNMQNASSTPDIISSARPSAAQTTENVASHLNPNTTISREYETNVQKEFYSQKSRDLDKKLSKTTTKIGRQCTVDNCGIHMATDDKYDYHISCHHNGKLKCPECKIFFQNVKPLHTHLWKAHDIDMELHSCDICDYKTYSLTRLNNIHKQTHNKVKKFPCPICKKTFKSSHQLVNHKLIHKKSVPSICPLCLKHLNGPREVKRHLEAVHERKKPFQCSECDYKSTTKTELKLHIRNHTGDKPYRCSHCNYRCSDHNAMRRHKIQHTKNKTYSCKYCPYTTIQSKCYKKHISKEHPDIQSDEILSCHLCSFKTLSKNKFINHLYTHSDKEGIQQMLLEITKTQSRINWTMPNVTNSEQHIKTDKIELNAGDQQDNPTNGCETNKNVSDISIELDDCDSQQEVINKNYTDEYSYSMNNPTETSHETTYHMQEVLTDLTKYDNNSDCLISESSNDTVGDRHQCYTPMSIQNANYGMTNLHPPAQNLHGFLNTAITTIGDSLMQNNYVSVVTANSSYSSNNLNLSTSIMGNFPIHLPPNPRLSIRRNLTLTPTDKIPLPVPKVMGPIITPGQILPIPSSSNSPVNQPLENEGHPKKKAKISVKSNLILKGPDQINMFDSEQNLAFAHLQENEHRMSLSSPVTFNNLITTQFMQLPPEPVLTNNPDDRLTNILPYTPEPMLGDQGITQNKNNGPLFTFNRQIDINQMNMLSQQVEQSKMSIICGNPSYIKLESKQSIQSPSLERMCTVNSMINTQGMVTDYCKSSPLLEEIHKNVNEIKNEVKSDTYYNMTMNNPAVGTPSVIDQHLIDTIIGAEMYAGHLDLPGIVLPEITEDEEQVDIIEIDDNSEDNKLLPPRYEINYPLESLYSMHNDFHFLENEMPQAYNVNMPESVNELNRMVAEVPMVSHNKDNNTTFENQGNDFSNFIDGKKDPMMNTTVRPTTNKINVKNIELMKN